MLLTLRGQHWPWLVPSLRAGCSCPEPASKRVLRVIGAWLSVRGKDRCVASRPGVCHVPASRSPRGRGHAANFLRDAFPELLSTKLCLSRSPWSVCYEFPQAQV